MTRARGWLATAALAAALLGSARAWGGDDPAAAVERARALLDGDRWREALRELEPIPGAAAAEPALQSLRGEALYRAGRFEEAIGLLAPLCERSDPPPRALLTLGQLRRAAGQHEEAARLVERALAADPGDPGLLYWAASFAPTQAIAVARLEAFLARAKSEDADRIEAARGSLEFYRAIGDRRTWIVERRPDRLELKLRALRERGAVVGWVLDASLGAGPAVPLLLDSGAGGLFLVDRTARKHGFAPLASETAFGGGGGGRHSTQRGVLPALSIGDLRFRDALANVSSAEVDPTGRYRGILGLDVFEGYRITLDLKRGRLILDAPSPDFPGQSYWSVAGQILVRAGPRSGPSGLFMVDTGASSSLVDITFAKSCPGVELTSATRVRGYGGEVRDARAVRGLRLVQDGAALEGDRIDAADLSLRSRMAGVEVSGFLGLDLWNGERVVIDTVARRMRAEKAGSSGGR